MAKSNRAVPGEPVVAANNPDDAEGPLSNDTLGAPRASAVEEDSDTPSPNDDLTIEQLVPILLERVESMQDELDTLGAQFDRLEMRVKRGVTPRDVEGPAAVEYMPYEEALAKARKTGEAVMSDKGMVMPPEPTG